MADELEQYKAKAGAPDELAQYAAKPSAKQPALGGNAAPEAPPRGVLSRFATSVGEAINPVNTVKGIYHSFADAPTAEEQQRFGVGTNPNPVERTALAGGRMFYQPVTTAVGDYAAGRVPLKGAMSVMPEALGTGVGTVAQGKMLGDVGGAIGRIGETKPYLRPVSEAAIEFGKRKAIPSEIRTAYNKVKASQTAVPTPPAAPAAPGTYSQTIPVRPSAAAPTYEAPLPGVNTAPNVGRMDFSEPTSALQRASEPPAPANPAAMPVRPSLDRIAEPEVARPSQSVKPVEPSAELPPTRAAEPSAPAGVKPVTPSDEAVARMERARGYRLGSHAGNPEAEAYLTKTNPELVAEANARKIDGRSDWKVEDLKRTGSKHGKFLAPAKEDLIGKLVQPDRGSLPKSTDISEAMSKDKSLADLSKHEANMRQRSLTAQQEREKLGPLGLKSQEPTTTSPPSPGQKATRYYNKYGKVERR
jgi:hypothetical protein